MCSERPRALAASGARRPCCLQRQCRLSGKSEKQRLPGGRPSLTGRTARCGCAERASFPPPDSGNFLQDLGLRMLGYHNWPIGYLARHYETVLDAKGDPLVPSHEQLPRGTVKKVA